MMYRIISLLLLIAFCSCKDKPMPKMVMKNLVLDTPDLKVKKLSDKSYIHVSYLKMKDGSKLECNGMIYLDAGLALIIDTPTTDEQSQVLLNFIQNNLKAKPHNVVVTHHHQDCLGGLKTFHRNFVQSISSDRTIAICKKKGLEVPKIGFDVNLSMRHGTAEIIGLYPGPGHTEDNIVMYLPDEKILFGGCVVKAVDAPKGYLGDASVKEWSESARHAKNSFLDLYMVVPGHGPEGGMELLDYTIDLFD